MFSFHKNLFHPVLLQHKQDFFEKRFMHNNLSILFLSVYLTIEQMYYCLYVREPGSFIQKVHFFTAIIMLFYAIVSIYIQMKRPLCTSWLHKIYEISFGFYGFLIAIIRGLLIPNNVFPLPTIYIAVLYGFAVIFCFHPVKSFFVYGLTSAILIVAFPIFQPTIIQNSYIQDILSNNIISWIASIINYEKYVKEFINQKIINQNNEELKEKTLQIEKMNEKLKAISIKDGLTNIYNRRKLDEILECEYNRAKRYCREFSIILLDLDWFKSVNDTYGHNVGDKVLIETCKILKNNIRNSDMVGRWGGEEFLIICPDTTMQQALHMAERLRKAIETYKFSVVNKRTGSFGVATYKNRDTIESLINRADKGLYKAKENGRNRVEITE
ncbi:GGDEF domain-containing protein [Clostridium ganghwense]|uniref:GGDEF domain-containing protein n=1 Tax=Clostridium ganghwense TaxID=312089 RepID=A0ABT4CJX1_9CLOT|nr:GGDEF domain-containing protein [Clostridium ganghwense]MCY6369349.1 GGDEF domain-containing protein [Clostridium ganghwense]